MHGRYCFIRINSCCFHSTTHARWWVFDVRAAMKFPNATIKFHFIWLNNCDKCFATVRRKLFYALFYTRNVHVWLTKRIRLAGKMLLAVLHRTLKTTSLICYLCKHSQRPQKLTYSYTQIFWVSCDQPMPGPFPFPNLRKCPGIEIALHS